MAGLAQLRRVSLNSNFIAARKWLVGNRVKVLRATRVLLERIVSRNRDASPIPLLHCLPSDGGGAGRRATDCAST